MSNRRLAAACAVIACVALAPACAATESTESSLRTAWGDPDLQGIWNNSTLTPFQRPTGQADKEFLTEEEAAGIEQAAADRNTDLASRPALRTAADPTGNVDRGVDGAPGSYNNFWMERGTTVLPTRRTSVITDPSNGRLPPLTPDVEAWMGSPEAARLADVRGGRLPTDTWEQLDGGDRCLWYRGIPSFPTAYNNHYQIVQNPDFVAILQEHIHDVRFIAPRRAVPHRSGHPPVCGRLARPLGGRHARRRDDALQPSCLHPELQREPERGVARNRTLHPRRRRTRSATSSR